MTCGDVAAYLDAFLDHEARARFDTAALSGHAGACAACATRLAGFFRVLELPESAYLRETLDELAIAMHGLALAVIRERQDPEANTDNLVPVAAPEGAADELARQGTEMADDAEDWAGSSRVAGRTFRGYGIFSTTPPALASESSTSRRRSVKRRRASRHGIFRGR
jgi:hypothetical protein